jgi:hypothetical protein
MFDSTVWLEALRRLMAFWSVEEVLEEALLEGGEMEPWR